MQYPFPSKSIPVKYSTLRSWATGSVVKWTPHHTAERPQESRFIKRHFDFWQQRYTDNVWSERCINCGMPDIHADCKHCVMWDKDVLHMYLIYRHLPRGTKFVCLFVVYFTVWCLWCDSFAAAKNIQHRKLMNGQAWIVVEMMTGETQLLGGGMLSPVPLFMSHRPRIWRLAVAVSVYAC